MFVNGIDISDFNAVASFHRVAASGVGFVYCKATQGTGNVQDTFAGYRDRIRTVDGLMFGAYHFLEWHADPVAQAEHFLSVYKPTNGDLPPMLDCEAFTVGRDAATATIAGFLKAVEPHLGGSRMLLYTNYAAINEQAFATDDFSGHLLWIAEYNNYPQPIIPRTWTKATIWQHTETATVPGIVGNVDGDRFMGTVDELRALALRGIAS